MITSNNWYNFIDMNHYQYNPINYLEIGSLYGPTILSVGISYGLHDDSKLYCLEPIEYFTREKEEKEEKEKIKEKEEIKSIINTIEKYGLKEKIIINNGNANIEIPKFQNDFFDIIHLDGRKGPQYSLENSVLSFRKLKKDGIMIMDEDDCDGFIGSYSKDKNIQYLGKKQYKVFIRKIK